MRRSDGRKYAVGKGVKEGNQKVVSKERRIVRAGCPQLLGRRPREEDERVEVRTMKGLLYLCCNRCGSQLVAAQNRPSDVLELTTFCGGAQTGLRSLEDRSLDSKARHDCRTGGQVAVWSAAAAESIPLICYHIDLEKQPDHPLQCSDDWTMGLSSPETAKLRVTTVGSWHLSTPSFHTGS